MLKYILIAFFLVVAIGLGYQWWSKKNQVEPQEIQDRQRLTAILAGHRLVVEAVTTPKSIELGLGGRSEIGADGMLFIFPEPVASNFWMKGMQFDLDLVWIKNSRVVSVTERVPALPLDTPNQNLPLYPSPGEVEMVLEIPAGKAAELGIVTGTILELK